MMSGRRNEPPISISSPRETIVSRPSASAFNASTNAPALLLTASAASAPVSRFSQPETWSSRSPRRPVSMSYSSVVGSRIAAAAAAIAASGRGARPRLVWSTVPVRLKTRRCDGRGKPRERPRALFDDRCHRSSCAGRPPLGQRRPDGIERQGAPISRDQRGAALGAQDAVHRRQGGAAMAIGGGHQAMAASGASDAALRLRNARAGRDRWRARSGRSARRDSRGARNSPKQDAARSAGRPASSPPAVCGSISKEAIGSASPASSAVIAARLSVCSELVMPRLKRSKAPSSAGIAVGVEHRIHLRGAQHFEQDGRATRTRSRRCRRWRRGGAGKSPKRRRIAASSRSRPRPRLPAPAAPVGGEDHAGAERLGQDQPVAGTQPALAQEFSRRVRARSRQSRAPARRPRRCARRSARRPPASSTSSAAPQHVKEVVLDDRRARRRQGGDGERGFRQRRPSHRCRSSAWVAAIRPNR